jgi:hypothetical protein
MGECYPVAVWTIRALVRTRRFRLRHEGEIISGAAKLRQMPKNGRLTAYSAPPNMYLHVDTSLQHDD